MDLPWLFRAVQDFLFATFLVMYRFVRSLIGAKPRKRAKNDPHQVIDWGILGQSSKIPIVTNILYSHGGFMGSSISMLQNEKHPWAETVKQLTPKTWGHLTAAYAHYLNSKEAGLRVDTPVATSAMWIMENNPVLAAYGTSETLRRSIAVRDSHSISHNPLVIEWDVYLPKSVCAEVAKTLEAKGAAKHVSSKLSPDDLASLYIEGFSAERDKAGTSETSIDGTGLSRAEYLELCSKVMDSCIVAHGTIRDIIQERAFGRCMFDSVAARTGGITIRQWLRIYLKSLQQHSPHIIEQIFNTDPTRADAMESNTGCREPIISVFLDIKTVSASSLILQCLMDGLNSIGVHVWGIGSFVHRQVVGLGSREQRIASSSLVHNELVDHLRNAEDYQDRRLGTVASAVKEIGPDNPLSTPFGSPVSTAVYRDNKGAMNGRGPSQLGVGVTEQDVGNNSNLPSEKLSSLDVVTAKPAISMYIYTMVGEIQAAALTKKLPRGTSVLFNGGSLLLSLTDRQYLRNNEDLEVSNIPEGHIETLSKQYHAPLELVHGLIHLNDTMKEMDFPWRIDIRTLLAFHSLCSVYDIRAGMYLQEPILDEGAARLLISLANLAAETFPLGLSYSNLNGEAPSLCDIPHGKGFNLPRLLDLLIRKDWDHSSQLSGASHHAFPLRKQ